METTATYEEPEALRDRIEAEREAVRRGGALLQNGWREQTRPIGAAWERFRAVQSARAKALVAWIAHAEAVIAKSRERERIEACFEEALALVLPEDVVPGRARGAVTRAAAAVGAVNVLRHEENVSPALGALLDAIAGSARDLTRAEIAVLRAADALAALDEGAGACRAEWAKAWDAVDHAARAYDEKIGPPSDLHRRLFERDERPLDRKELFGFGWFDVRDWMRRGFKKKLAVAGVSCAVAGVVLVVHTRGHHANGSGHIAAGTVHHGVQR